MSDFFKKDKNLKTVEQDALEMAFVPDSENEDEVNTEESNAKKRELFQSFNNKRFTEIARNAESYASKKDNHTINNGPQLINIDALEIYISKIVDEKIAQFEMKLKMEQDLKDNK